MALASWARVSLCVMVLILGGWIAVATGRTGQRQDLHPTPSPYTSSGSYADSVISLKQWRVADGGNDHWYGVLAVAHDWIEADSVARTLALDTMSGYLATILGASENRFVFDSVLAGVDPPTIPDQLLLGGLEVSGDWAWITSEPFCYTNWAQGEPNFHGTETVITMYGPSQTPQPLPLRSWNNARSSDSLVSSARFWAIVEWGEPNLAPTPTCGDGIAECSEDCDDGNQIEGDGCDSTCEQADCGDGALQPGEECDDGNLVDGDGCEATCEFTCVPGDVNASLSATVSDVICLLHHVFLTLKCFPQPCWSAGDMNCNGVVTSADIITLINYLFKSMPLAECDRCAPCGV